MGQQQSGGSPLSLSLSECPPYLFPLFALLLLYSLQRERATSLALFSLNGSPPYA